MKDRGRKEGRENESTAITHFASRWPHQHHHRRRRRQRAALTNENEKKGRRKKREEEEKKREGFDFNMWEIVLVAVLTYLVLRIAMFLKTGQITVLSLAEAQFMQFLDQTVICRSSNASERRSRRTFTRTRLLHGYQI